MDTHFNGIVFCGKSKSIPPHGVNHIMSVHQFISAPHIGDYITSPVAYMKPISRRVGKHIQAVIFFFLPIIHINGMFFPVFTPFLFDGSVVVRYRHSHFLLKNITVCKDMKSRFCKL